MTRIHHLHSEALGRYSVELHSRRTGILLFDLRFAMHKGQGMKVSFAVGVVKF